MSELRTGSFESLLSQPDAHVVFDFSPEANTLLVLFGGIAGGVSMPVFEFFRVASSIPSRKAFLRDPRRGWYQLGIPGVGDSAGAVKSLLDEIIDQSGADRVVMAGASAGGFAALLFGAQCAADEVIAFSPQTFVDAQNRSVHDDQRWGEQIAALHAATCGRNATLDLFDVLSNAPPTTRFQLHVSSDDALDLVHARRVASRPGVDVVAHERGGHRLVMTLRDRGQLEPILRAALTGVSG